MLRSWLRRPRTSKKVPTRPRFRPSVELLEDRTTPSAAFALSDINAGVGNLLAFDTDRPTETTVRTITGILGTEVLAGIDFRPQDGLLYGLGVNAGADTATLYKISTSTGAATVVGVASSIAFQTGGGAAIDLPLVGTGYGVDFNPAADRLRVVAGTLNFRVNPNDGTPVDGAAGTANTNPDGNINGGTTSVDATAYTNNYKNNGNITTQYTLDAVTDSLFIQNAPNSGTQTMGKTVTLNGATLNFDFINGFDIPQGVNAASSNAAVTTGYAFAILSVGGASGLYRINLVNAQAELIGPVGNGTKVINGLALQNIPDNGSTPVATGSKIRIVNAAGGVTSTVSPFAGFTGAVNTAKGDVNGDYVDDTIAVAPVSGHVKVLDGVTGAEIRSFFAFEGFIGEVFVGSGDVNRDGRDDIIVGSSTGGHIKVFSGFTGELLYSFLPFAGFTGGVRVASGDIDNDGYDDIIVGTSINGHVKVFSGKTGLEIRSFTAFESYSGGLYVAAGDVDGDGQIDIITGADINGHVKAINGADVSKTVRSFLAFPGFIGQTRVASRNLNGDATDDFIVATGPNSQSVIRSFDSLTLAAIFNVTVDEFARFGSSVG